MARSFISRPLVHAALERAYDVGASTILVSGPPGCGKSQLVARWLDDLDDRHITVPLADVADEAAMLARVAATLEMTDQADVAAIGLALRAAGPTTVVFDDFDRVAGVGETLLTRWREAAPLARWVVTSRQRLEIDDFDSVEVGPMTRDQAIALFEARAQNIRPEFSADDALRGVIGRLADELDCIPLAVELAAARVNALGPAEILDRMPDRFRILRERGKTLQGAILLSWELLDDVERDVLAQCAVFRGGFSTEAAEAIVALPDDAPWVVDVLQELVDRSLLRSVAAAGLEGEVRFELLGSIREFVIDRCPPDPDLLARHSRAYLEWCRGWTYQMRRREGASARIRLELEQDNLLAALDGANDPGLVVDLALTLDKSFRLRAAHERWEDILGHARVNLAAADPRAARIHRAIGELHLLRGRFDAARGSLQEAAQAAQAAGEWVTLAWTWFLLGEVERRTGSAGAARESLERAIELAREHGIANVERMALGHIAGCLVDVGELGAAREAIQAMSRISPSDDLRDEANLLKRVAYAQHYLGNADEQLRLTRVALELSRESGDRRLEALCIQGLGDAAFVRRDFPAAREAWTDALALHRAHGSSELEGALLGNLGNLEHRLDNLDEARRAYRAALELHARTGAKPYEAVVWFGLGVLEFELHHFADASAALERAAELNTQIGNTSDFGSCRLVSAWVAEAQGEAGSRCRAEAAEAFTRAGDADWAVLCGDNPGTDDVSDSTVHACIEALLGRGADDRSRLHVRAALALRGRPAAPAAAAVALRIAADALWFEVDGERLNMRRRRAPRHILAMLVELWREQPGAALDVEQAFAVGWPDEFATIEAANDRVYWAIRTLRKLGLEAVLLTGGEGYLLDPDANIEVE